MLPLSTRKKIAAKARQQSQEKQQQLSEDIMDVTPEEVISSLETNNVKRLIHGHTHRPDVHQVTANGHDAQRIVLGDWYTQGSVLTVTKDGFNLEQHPF